MVEVGAAVVVVKGEFDEIKSARFLQQEDLLLLVEHPLHGSKGAIKGDILFTEPFPIASVKDVDILFKGSNTDAVDSEQA
jgi:hypothetical protein